MADKPESLVEAESPAISTSFARNTPSDVRALRPSEPPPRHSEPPPLDYTELEGGLGKDVFYRPDRYQRSDLGSIRVAVDFRHGEFSHSCELYDVSQNGVAFEWTHGTPIEVGSEIDELVVRFDQYEAYRGQAKVSSLRRIGSMVVVGVSLLDTLMNIEDVLQLRDVKAWDAGATSDKLRMLEAPWKVAGQHEYKSLVAELRLFLEDGQRQLSELEASLPIHISQGDQSSPARDALIERVRNGFSMDIVNASNEMDRALRTASHGEREGLLEFSQRHLHPLLMQAPWMHRARHKPLGYPGDYELMNGLYGNHFSGATLFAKAVNLAFVSTPAAEAVRTRKDLMKRELSKVIDLASPERPVRILSIAAGPGQEVFELLQERKEIAGPVEIVLFEQDRRALAFSYQRLNRLVKSKWSSQVKLVLLHDSIKRLLRGSTVFTGQFDMVYACGLCDYLQYHTWVKLCRTLFSTVAPGGRLYVGNMVPGSQSRWFMELHLDWLLVYREHEEMLALARVAAPSAQLELMTEPTGVNPFVALTRVS
jgi:extracellular factor (EF) 3-hydroxypalmitic acid methyl ester biosynthesis protein